MLTQLYISILADFLLSINLLNKSPNEAEFNFSLNHNKLEMEAHARHGSMCREIFDVPKEIFDILTTLGKPRNLPK